MRNILLYLVLGQVVSPAKDTQLRQAFPPTTDAQLNQIFSDPATVLYTEVEMPPAFQRNGRFQLGVSGVDTDGNDAVPWRTPGGLQRAPGIGTFRFLSLPKREDGSLWPVILTTRKLDRQDANDSIAWYFPVGTTIGEVITERGPDGRDYTFEVRTRTREEDDWGIEIYRPFPNVVSLMDGIELLRPEWEKDPPLVEAMARLRRPPVRLQNLKDNTARNPGSVFNSTQLTEVLPPLPQTLVSELLTKATFEPCSTMFWREGKTQVVFAPTANDFNIVPRAYDGGFLGNSRQQCFNCHRTVGMASVRFDQTWSGHIRGSDGIFSFRPISVRDQQPRTELVNAGLVAVYDKNVHPGSIYTSIGKLRHDQ